MTYAEDLAREVSSLFSLPDAVIRVNELLDQPNTTNRALAEVIRYDAGLSARILRLVNSAYFGLPRSIETIDRAVAMTGRTELRILVLATSLTCVLDKVPANGLDMDAFWNRSVSCAMLARMLAKRQRRVAEADRLFVAGLLHEIGMLAFFSTRPVPYRAAIERAGHEGVPVERAERQAFGFDHNDLGATLLEIWKLPEPLPALVRYRQRPDEAPEAVQASAEMLHAAAAIAAWMSRQGDKEEDLGPVIDTDIRQRLALDEGVVDELAEEANMTALEVLQIVAPNAATIY